MKDTATDGTWTIPATGNRNYEGNLYPRRSVTRLPRTSVTQYDIALCWMEHDQSKDPMFSAPNPYKNEFHDHAATCDIYTNNVPHAKWWTTVGGFEAYPVIFQRTLEAFQSSPESIMCCKKIPIGQSAVRVSSVEIPSPVLWTACYIR